MPEFRKHLLQIAAKSNIDLNDGAQRMFFNDLFERLFFDDEPTPAGSRSYPAPPHCPTNVGV